MGDTADTASVKPRLSPRLRPKPTAAMAATVDTMVDTVVDMAVTDMADTASARLRLTAATAATAAMVDTVVVMAVMVDTADTTVRFFILPHSLPHYDLQPQSKDIFCLKGSKVINVIH